MQRYDFELISSWIPERSRVLDLGCGDGVLMAGLAATRGVRGYGVEIDEAHVLAAVKNGVNVIQDDLETGLATFRDNAFDFVILSQTLQAMHNVEGVMRAMLRVGREGIVTFPNFGYWRHRLDVVLGRMPVSKTLPHTWYNTPNLHLCTVKDFETCGRGRVPMTSAYPPSRRSRCCPTVRHGVRFRSRAYGRRPMSTPEPARHLRWLDSEHTTLPGTAYFGPPAEPRGALTNRRRLSRSPDSPRARSVRDSNPACGSLASDLSAAMLALRPGSPAPKASPREADTPAALADGEFAAVVARSASCSARQSEGVLGSGGCLPGGALLFAPGIASKKIPRPCRYRNAESRARRPDLVFHHCSADPALATASGRGSSTCASTMCRSKCPA